MAGAKVPHSTSGGNGVRPALNPWHESLMTSTSRTQSSSTLRALSDDLTAAVESASRSVVAIHARQRIAASGIYWRDGVVVAASHTIRKEQEIGVTLPNGTRATANLVGRDGGTDLAVLRLDPPPATAAVALPSFASADALRVGALVLAVG